MKFVLRGNWPRAQPPECIPRLRAPRTLAVDDLLAPLAQDLREWWLASGRPGDDEPIIPGEPDALARGRR